MGIAQKNMPDSHRIKWLRMIGYIPLTLLIISVFLFQNRSLVGSDEGRYTAVALEMLRTKDITSLRLSEGLPHFTKPPMLQAAIAASVSLFGQHEWVARLPNSIAWILTILLLLRIGKLTSPRRPRLAALVYITLPLPFVAASIITTDTLLTLFQTLACLSYMTARFRVPVSRSNIEITTMWMAWSAAFLTKGPVALLPLFPILVFEGVSSGTAGLKWLCWRLSLPVSILFGLSWFIATAMSNPGLLSYWLGVETVGRITGSQKRHNASAIKILTMYLPILVFGTLPWTDVLIHKLRNIRVTRIGKPLTGWAKANPMETYLILWFTIPVIFLSLFPSRSMLYLLPSFVPLALLLTRWNKAPNISIQRGIAITVLVLICLSGQFLAVHSVKRHKVWQLISADVLKIAPHAERIILVDDSPWYGLRWYLNKPLEAAVLDVTLIHSAFTGPQQKLIDVLFQLPGRTVLVVQAPKLEWLESILNAAGRPFKMIGSLNVRNERILFLECL